MSGPHIRHCGWKVEQSITCFEGTHPDFRGPGDDRFVEAETLEELAQAIEDWIAEHGK